MQGSRSTTGASAYGSTPRTSRTSSRPPPSRASPSNLIDVDRIKDAADGVGDGAEAPATSTSARRCRSVASAPARPSRSLDPFSAPNYSQSAYAGSSKGKGGPSSKGGKGASGWNQSWVDSSWTGRPSTCRNEPSWERDLNAPNDEPWVDQSWLSKAPRTQATTRTKQSDSYFEQDDEDDAYGDLPDSYINDDEEEGR